MPRCSRLRAVLASARLLSRPTAALRCAQSRHSPSARLRVLLLHSD
jgi:hypothetical protein